MSDYSLLNDPEMADIFEGFVVETGEILEKLDLGLVELEDRPDDDELLNEIFRAFHTIKGTSGFLGLVKLQKITHKGEDILNKLRKGEIKLNEEIMDAILNTYDTIKELVQIISETKTEELDVSEILSELETLINRLNNPSAVEIEESEAESVDVSENSGEIEEKTNTEEINEFKTISEIQLLTRRVERLEKALKTKDVVEKAEAVFKEAPSVKAEDLPF